MKNVLVDDARDLMLAEVRPLGAETVALESALGRTLAEPIDAVRAQPPFHASAMDGYAVRAADAVKGAILAVVGESAAGKPHPGAVAPGEAVRIFTGAPMPAGADSVVIQEDVERQDGAISIRETAIRGRNIRPAGGDFKSGQRLLEAGIRLDPWRISLAAAAGRGELAVARRPRVAILSTGDEIVPPGARAAAHQIYNSGGPALAALVARWGGEPILLHPAGDDMAVIASSVEQAGCDVVATIGGASVGDHDLVKPALSRLGLRLIFENLKMRPGKPTSFGLLADGRYAVGLPGNPASALVCAQLFLKGLLSALQGGDPALGLVTARLGADLAANGPREHWMRALLRPQDGVLTVYPMDDQDSSLVTVFASAEALLRRPCDAPAAKRGSVVEVLPLDRDR